MGKALIEELMKLAKEKFNIEILHLEVYKGNPAKDFMRELGFEEFGCQTQFIKEEWEIHRQIFHAKIL